MDAHPRLKWRFKIILLWRFEYPNLIIDNIMTFKGRDLKWVKEEILNSVMSHLKTIFDLGNMPIGKDMEEIAVKLGHVYPSMFFDNGG